MNQSSPDNSQNIITSLQATITAYEKTNHLQNDKLSNQDILIIDLKAKISTLQRCQIENIKYQQDLTKANDIIQSKNKTIAEYQILSSLSTSKFEHYLKTNQAYKATIDKQADTIKELQEKNMQLEIGINDLKSTNEGIKQKALELNSLVNTYIDPKTHNEQIGQIEDVLSQLQHELKTSQQQSALLIAKNDQVKQQYNDLQKEHSELIGNHQGKEKELTGSKNQCEILSTKVLSYQNEVEHLNNVLRLKDGDIDQLTVANKELVSHNQTINESLKQCEMRLHDQDEKIHELNGLCNQFETAYNEVIKDLEKKNSGIESLYQTISNKTNECEIIKNEYETKIAEMAIEMNDLKNKEKNLRDTLINLKEYSQFIESSSRVNPVNNKGNDNSLYGTTGSMMDNNDNHKYSYMLIDNLKDVIRQIDNKTIENQSFSYQYDSQSN